MADGGPGMKVRFAVAPPAGLLEGPEIVDFADTLEASGFDGVWLSDVPVGAVIDPLLGLALIAGRTERVKLGANVVPLGRNPFLLAKSLAALDRVSGGRLLLSFVPGLDQPGEREALGWQGAGRGAVLEDALAAVRAWWSAEPHGGSPGHPRGPHEVVRPAQDPLEVWLGGRGPKALERVGRIADGWLGALVDPDEARAARIAIQESAQRAGRTLDPEHFGLSVAYARETPSAEQLGVMRGRRQDIDPLLLLPVGAPSLRALLGRYIDAGLSKFVLRPATKPADWSEEVQWLAGAVLDLQS
jgi:probable F420-dependent oxidoreductase